MRERKKIKKKYINERPRDRLVSFPYVDVTISLRRSDITLQNRLNHKNYIDSNKILRGKAKWMTKELHIFVFLTEYRVLIL